MSITRFLPKSARGRKQFLDACYAKNESVIIAERIITGTLEVRLATSQGVQNDGMHTVSLAKTAMNNYTPVLEKSFNTEKELIASYFKGLFRIVRKVDMRPGDVSYYHLPLTKFAAPRIKNHGLATLWGGYIATGETDRVAAGGTAMANPSAADVAGGTSDFDGKLLIQSGLKETFGNAGVALDATNPATDIVVKKCYDTLGTYYDEGADSTKRLRMRDYGCVFVSKIKKTFNVTVLNTVTGLPIPAAELELIETGLSRVANSLGFYAMISTITAKATFHASAVGFADAEVAVTVSEDTLIYTVTIHLTPLV
jgi:hypothetical protein